MRRYAVLKHGDDWRLVDACGRIEDFQSCGAARRTADALTRALRRMGHEVELLVQSPGGELSRVSVPLEIH